VSLRKGKRRPSLAAPIALETVLAKSGEQRFSAVKLAVPHRIWKDAVGPKIAARAFPSELSRGLLTVRVASSSWASELSFLSEAILERLRACGLHVQKMRFQVGEVTHFERPIERRVSKKVPTPVALPEALKRDIAQVADEELRSLLTETAAMSLATSASWQGAASPPSAGTRTDPPGHIHAHSDESDPRTPASGARRDS
jgi:hypothetical protein